MFRGTPSWTDEEQWGRGLRVQFRGLTAYMPGVRKAQALAERQGAVMPKARGACSEGTFLPRQLAAMGRPCPSPDSGGSKPPGNPAGARDGLAWGRAEPAGCRERRSRRRSPSRRGAGAGATPSTAARRTPLHPCAADGRGTPPAAAAAPVRRQPA